MGVGGALTEGNLSMVERRMQQIRRRRTWHSVLSDATVWTTKFSHFSPEPSSPWRGPVWPLVAPSLCSVSAFDFALAPPALWPSAFLLRR